MDRDRYLERIGVDGDRLTEDRFELLATLQRRHLRTVPFTNCFVLEGTGTTLRPDRAVPRIASGGGGLCYDLNGGFAWLLEEFGYDVALVSARPVRDDGSCGPEYDHLALTVDGHLVDVGFGEFARRPLPLDGEPRSDPSGTYRVVREEDHVVEKRTDDGWEATYRFDPTPREASEFEEMCRHHASSPDSPFTGDLLATIATETGRITLSDTSLTVREGETREKRDVADGDVADVLCERFGLEVEPN
ncbi:arylamine N-acetyltransferase family protein [Natrarchaeobius oligotrophus]|uniref:Acetyltransferase n=1 Tax=Natrarchaeobius chitinivorans TaxID=1679083 RepID=A0A3N6M5A2_NATCH|nr:arylamine N-acetyltransferase [Natrarchaeobius chitinivorans]RQG98753.1 acetyltransferase [Natrarchaeobius chitinivorans]